MKCQFSFYHHLKTKSDNYQNKYTLRHFNIFYTTYLLHFLLDLKRIKTKRRVLFNVHLYWLISATYKHLGVRGLRRMCWMRLPQDRRQWESSSEWRIAQTLAAIDDWWRGGEGAGSHLKAQVGSFLRSRLACVWTFSLGWAWETETNGENNLMRTFKRLFRDASVSLFAKASSGNKLEMICWTDRICWHTDALKTTAFWNEKKWERGMKEKTSRGYEQQTERRGNIMKSCLSRAGEPSLQHVYYKKANWQMGGNNQTVTNLVDDKKMARVRVERRWKFGGEQWTCDARNNRVYKNNFYNTIYKKRPLLLLSSSPSLIILLQSYPKPIVVICRGWRWNLNKQINLCEHKTPT